MYKMIGLTRGNGTKVTQLNKSEAQYTEANPLTRATLTRSVFVREDNNRPSLHSPVLKKKGLCLPDFNVKLPKLSIS